MFKYSKLAAILAVGLMGLTWGAPAQAQATRTWISGVGDDVNPCSRTAPCKTFPGAISKTAAGGEIDTLDPGGFGAVTVTKAITLANEGIGEAGILVAGTNGVTINCATDPNCVVVLRGLQIDGGPTGSNSLNGVRIISAHETIIQNCVIRNFTGGSPNGFGVNMNTSATSYLDITDSTFSVNGQLGSGIGGGIQIMPSGTAPTYFTLTNVHLLNNAGNGLKIDTSSLVAGTITGTIVRSNLSGNTGGGLTVNGGTTATNIVVEDTNLSNNTGVGIFVSGSATNAFVSRSVLSGNGQAFAISSGRINSFGDNDAVGNTTGSSPSTPVLTHS